MEGTVLSSAPTPEGVRVSGFEYRGPIGTERLLLRTFEPGDFEAMFAMRSDPDVARFTYWEPQSAEGSRQALERRIRFRALRDEGDVLALAGVLRTTGKLVADVILNWLSREHGTGEIGFVVHPAHQGRGYATEASRPLLRVAFEEVGLHRVIGRTEARNTASARVLAKLGMRQEAHLVENEWVKGEWQSELVYAILDREWRAAEDGARPT
jgi:RimJ/RimL family protein N-acetyltransferase